MLPEKNIEGVADKSVKADRAERTDATEKTDRPAKRFARRSRKKVCAFCVDRSGSEIDYKDVAKLRRFVSDRAKILPRRVTGTCSYHQHVLSKAIHRARVVALLPFVVE